MSLEDLNPFSSYPQELERNPFIAITFTEMSRKKSCRRLGVPLVTKKVRRTERERNTGRDKKAERGMKTERTEREREDQ